MRRREPVSHHHLPARPGTRGRALGWKGPVERMRLTVILVLLIAHQWALVWALDRRVKR